MASKGKILRIVAVLTLAAIATTSLYQVVPAAVADFATLKARYEIERLRDGQRPMPTLPAWAQLRDDLAQAASWVPDNPRWYDDLGFLYVLRARNTPNVPELAALRRLGFEPDALTKHTSPRQAACCAPPNEGRAQHDLNADQPTGREQALRAPE